MAEKVIIYSDGACRGNPGVGGWGVVLRSVNGLEGAQHEKRLLGYEPMTTNNKMELTAVIEGLSSLKRPCEVEVYTDSKYVIQGITEWIHGWVRKNWKTSAGGSVKNQELWRRLWELVQAQVNVDWHWVKGHSGNPGNELADALANQAIDRALD